MASVISTVRPVPGVPGGHPHHGRVQVHQVGDQLDGHPLVVQQRADRAGLAVVQRAHPVEQVGGDRRARVDRGHDLGQRGVGVPDRGDGALADQPADRVHGVGQLGGQGDHPHRALARVEQGLHRRAVRRTQDGRVVRAAAGRRQERALQVDAAERAVRDQLGEPADLLTELVDRPGDQARHQGGGAVLEVRVDGLEDAVLVRCGERLAATAVAVDVHEAGHDPATGRVGHRPGRIGWQLPWSDGRDQPVVDGHPAGIEHPVRGDDPAAGYRCCSHLPLLASSAWSQSIGLNQPERQLGVFMTFCSASSARLAVDLTVPLEMPAASAISASDRLP